jgi:ribosomal protein S18 acetylase RimI-like enzyme
MIEIKRLDELGSADLKRLISGYTSNSKYLVSKSETDNEFAIALKLVELSKPYVKQYNNLDAETIAHYLHIAGNEFSVGAFDNGMCVGIALAEARLWNRSLSAAEFHIAETHRRQGIGRMLLEALLERAREAKLRTMVCETQNTNPSAISFYRSLGFNIEGIDLSHYSNEDFPDGEIAIFMKKRID